MVEPKRLSIKALAWLQLIGKHYRSNSTSTLPSRAKETVTRTTKFRALLSSSKKQFRAGPNDSLILPEIIPAPQIRVKLHRYKRDQHISMPDVLRRHAAVQCLNSHGKLVSLLAMMTNISQLHRLLQLPPQQLLPAMPLRTTWMRSNCLRRTYITAAPQQHRCVA